MLTLNLDNQTEKQFNKLLENSGMDFSTLISTMINISIS
jgi:antitoxin component of RelBE/YafQ-DinJ toxin-antitoxin module